MTTIPVTADPISTVGGANLIDLLGRAYLGAERHEAIRAELARRAACGDSRYSEYAR